MKGNTLKIIVLFGLVGAVVAANAADGTNVLEPLMKNAKATVDGSKWLLYAGEVIAASVGYMMTRKWTIFGGIGFLMIYANTILGWA